MDVTVADILDEAPLGRFHWLIVMLGFLVMVIDGYDLVVMGLVVPAVASEWSLPPAGFSVVLSAALFGVLFGSGCAGWLADRLGRRAVLVGMLVIAGVGMAGSAFAADPTALSAWRLLTGFGAGGSIPVAIAYTSEFTPARFRNRLTVAMYAGTTMGGVVAGFTAPALLEFDGWQAVFIAGGGMSLLAAALCASLLPESIRFLTASGATPQRIAAVLRKVHPVAAAAFKVSSPAEGAGGASRTRVRDLFKGELLFVTPIIWLMFIANQAIVFLISSWLPTLFTFAGMALDRSLHVIALYSAGGLLGGLLFGWAGDRRGTTSTLAWSYPAAAVCIVALGYAAEPSGPVVIAAICAGVTVLGSSLLLGAMTAGMYPTAVRATGLGWAFGLGRLGAIVGPVIGGAAIADGWSVRQIMGSAAILPLLAGTGALTLMFLAPSARDRRGFQ